MMNEHALKERLKAIANMKDVNFNVVWKQLILERFLVRLAQSEHMDKFIFKGGYLLSYIMKIGRETTDLDFLLTRIKAEESQIRKVIDGIVFSKSDDGFEFVFDGIEILFQPHMGYPGYRIKLRVSFGKMKDRIQIDVGVGDSVEPEKRNFTLFEYRGQAFFEGGVSLQVYPVEAIFAEKLETIISKGAANSRMKDYHDLFLLVHEKNLINREKLSLFIENTFRNRGTSVHFIRFNAVDLITLQRLWRAHYRGLGKTAEELGLPEEIETVIFEINNFL